jgi:oligopeptide transport system substrate-binding protein
VIRRRPAAASLLAGLVACAPAPEEQAARVASIGGESGSELAELQILHKGNGSEPQTLDPHRAEGVPSSNIMRDLFEGLTSEAPDGSVIPGAAESWAVSEDGKVYTFRLRPDARWSNGDPVTAADFAYGLRRSVDPATLSLYSSILHPIENAEAIIGGERAAAELGVEALDDSTLEIRLTGPTPYLLGLLNHSTTYAVHRPSVEQYGDRFPRAGNLVGNGAYRLDEWVVQSHIKLVRNEFYWDDENTRIEEVHYHPIENQDAELKRYRADELDYTTVVPYKQLTWIRENLGDDLVIAPYLGSYYFGYNLTKPPFKGQPELRRALAMAIDREILTERVTGAGEIVAYGWVPPVNDYQGQQPAWASWTQEQRNREAQRLYAEAGYSADNPLQVQILYNTSENHKRVSVAIASMWKQVLGVESSLENQEWKVFLQTRRAKETTQVFRAGWIGDYNDAYSFAQLMHAKNEQNDSGYASPEYDSLLDRTAMEGDPDERARLMEAAERRLLEDMPIIPVYFYVSKHLVKPWVGGYQSNIMDHHYTKNQFILKH